VKNKQIIIDGIKKARQLRRAFFWLIRLNINFCCFKLFRFEAHGQPPSILIFPVILSVFVLPSAFNRKQIIKCFILKVL